VIAPSGNLAAQKSSYSPVRVPIERERVVLGEIGENITLEEVAARLWVTRNTVKTQLRSAYRKIGVSTRAEAVAWARAHGI
jgi:LuxR family transcriptional regulator of spore coat protein